MYVYIYICSICIFMYVIYVYHSIQIPVICDFANRAIFFTTLVSTKEAAPPDVGPFGMLLWQPGTSCVQLSSKMKLSVVLSRERVHIPPNGKRKIIDSKVSLGWNMLAPRRVTFYEEFRLTQQKGWEKLLPAPSLTWISYEIWPPGFANEDCHSLKTSPIAEFDVSNVQNP